MQEGWKHRESYRQFKEEAVKNEGVASALMTKNDKKQGYNRDQIQITLCGPAYPAYRTGRLTPEEIEIVHDS